MSSVAFSPDGQTLASGSFDLTIILWDVATGKPRGAPLVGHGSEVFSVAFSPDGSTLASGGCELRDGPGCKKGAVRLWDAATGQPRGEPLSVEPMGTVWSLAFSPDGVTLASVGGLGTVILWDVAALADSRRSPCG